MRKILLFLSVSIVLNFICPSDLLAQPGLVDDLNGLTVGDLNGQGGWARTSGSVTNLSVANSSPISGNLGYASAGGTGGAGGNYFSPGAYTGSTSRYTKSIGTGFAMGTAGNAAYYSLLINVSAATASGDYFLSLNTGTNYAARLFVRSSGAGYNFGVSKNSTTGNFGTTVFNFNTTYLVVVRLFIVTGSSNDQVHLWVNPTLTAEPSTSSGFEVALLGTSDASSATYNNIVWSNISANEPTYTFDGLRVAYASSSPVAWQNLMANADYYLASSGNANGLASWGSATNGTGVTPPVFTDDYHRFNLRNNATPTIGANWTVSGTSSKAIVGDGTNSCTFTIPSSFSYTGTIDVANAGTLKIQHTSIPTLGTLSTGSTVNYNASGSSQTVTGTTYHHLTVENSSNVSLGGNTTVNGTLTLTSGNLSIGANDLTLTQANAVGGTPGTTNHIQTGSTGVVKSTYTTGSYTFPVGYNGSNYNPVTLTNSSGSSQTYTVNAVATSSVSTLTNSLKASWSIGGITASSSGISIPWNSTNDPVSSAPTNGVLYKFVASAWSSQGGSTTGSSPNYTSSITGISSSNPSYWTVAPPAGAVSTFASAGTNLASTPLIANATNQAILGFSASASGGTPNFTDIQISTGGSSNLAASFSQLRLVTFNSGASSVYGTGSKTVLATDAAPTGTSVLFSGLSQSLSGTAKYYFLEGDVKSTVTVSTPSVTPTFNASTDVVVSSGTSTGTVTGSAYSFAAFGALDHFDLSQGIGTQTAGTPFSVTITAQDVWNNTITNFATNTTISVNAGTVSPTSVSGASFTSGVYTGNFTVNLAGTGRIITATASTKTGSTNAFDVNPGALNNFLVEAAGGGAIGTQTAGSSFNIKITARDANNNTVTSFTGTTDITSNGTLSTGSGTTAAFTAGVLSSHTVAITTAGSRTITATRTGFSESGTSASFTVDPATLNNFLVEAAGGGSIGTQTAGTSFNIKVTARDQYNNTLSSGANTYTGTVDITSNGTLSAGSGTTGAFTAGVLASRAVTISNTGSFSITATKTGSTETGTSNAFTVNPGALDHFGFASVSSPQVAGTAYSYTITAQDVNNNTVTSFTSTAAMTTNAGTISPSTSNAFTAGVLTQSFSVTQAGSGKNITATASGKTGTSGNFTVQPAALDNFLVEAAGGGSIGTQVTNSAFNIQVTARDVYNNTLSSGPNTFTGTVDITSSGSLSGSPVTSSAFSAGVLSSQSVTITAANASVTLTATRTGGSETGTSNTFTVSGGAPTQMAITSTIGTQTAGTSFSVTVESQNGSGTPTPVIGAKTINLSVYTGTGSLSGTVSGIIPDGSSSVTITGVIYTKAETGVVLSAVDAGATMTAGQSNAFDVTHAALDHFAISTPTSPQTAGTAYSYTITAQDAYNNTVTSFTSTATMSTNAGTISPSTSNAFTAGVLTQSFSVTQAGTGKTITATASGKTGTSSTFTVNAASLDHFAFNTISSPQTAGTAFSVTVTAQDLYDNTVTGFTGTVDFSTTAGSVSPTTSNSFSAGVLTQNVTVTQSGTGKTLTATKTGSTETGTSNTFNVNAGALDHFDFSAPSDPQTAGTAYSYTITAQDANNNTVTSFTGTAAMTTNAGTIAPSTSNAFSGGVLTQSFSVTQAGAGKTITATASAKTGASNSFTVEPAALNSFKVEAVGGGAIATQTAGTPFNIQVTAVDQYNNTLSSGANTFTGTVDITCNGTITSGNGTTASFVSGVLSSHSVTITQAGSRTITATKTGSSETGTSASFTVNAATASQLSIATISSPQMASTAFSVTVNVQDAYGNAANVTSNSNISLSVNTGTGALGGTTTGTINSGTSTVTISGVTYDTPEAGVSLTATQSTGTPSLTAANSNTFTVNAAPPTVTTTAVSGTTGISTSTGGNVTSDGGAAITERGVVISTSVNPTTADTKFVDGSATTGSFTTTVTGLTPSTTYNIRAYAINSSGTSYGANVQFTTASSTSFYNVLNTDITNKNNWWTNTNGTGINPSSFTANGQVFNVIYNTGANMSTTLTVSGTGSKIVVGDGTNAATLTGNQAITATVDVSNAGTLLLQTTTIPTLGTLATGSTINYGGSAITQAVTATTYSNLTLSGSGTRTFSGTTNIAGTFTPGTGFSASAGTIVFTSTSASQTIAGGFSYSGLTVQGVDGKSTGGNLTVTGLLTATNSFTVASGHTLTYGSAATISTAAGKTITVSGVFENQVNSLSFNAGTGSMSIAAGGVYKVTGYTTAASASALSFTNVTFTAGIGSNGGTLYVACTGGPRIPTSNAGNVIYAAGNNTMLFGTTTIGGNFTLESGIVNHGTGGTGRTLTVSGDVNINGGEYDVAGSGASASNTLTVTGTINVAGGILYASVTSTGGGSGTINCNGNLNHTSGSFGNGVGITSGSVVFGSTTANQTITTTGFSNQINMTVNNTRVGGGTVTINNAITVRNLTLTAGTLAGANLLSVIGGSTVTRTAGSLTGNPTYITSAVNVTYNGATSVSAGPELSPAAGSIGTLTLNSTGNTYTLSNNISVSAVTITAGTLDASTSNYNIVVSGNWSNAGAFTARSGTVTFGSSTISGVATHAFNNVVITTSLTAPATMSLTGDFTNNGSFTHSSGTVTFNGSNALQTISGNATTFSTLAIVKTTQSNTLEATAVIGTTAVTLTSGTLKISSASTLTLSTGSFDIVAAAGFTLNHASSIANIGPGGNLTVSGALEITSSGGTINLGNGQNRLENVTGGTGTITFSGGTVNIGGRFLMTAGTTTINGTAAINIDPQTTNNLVASTAIFEAVGNANVSFTGGTVTLVDAHAASGAANSVQIVSGAGTKNFAGSTIRLGNGASSTSTIDGFEVNAGVTLGNLVVDNPTGASRVVKLVTNNLALAGNLTINAGTLNANNLNISLAGNWSNSGTFTSASPTVVTFNGATGNQTITNATGETFSALTINKATSGNVVLVGNVNVTGVLTLTKGLVDGNTNNKTLTLGTAGTTSGASAASYVSGVLVKTIANATANPAFTFPVGDASGYGPVTFTGSGTTSAQGTLSVSSTNGVFNTPSGSGISTTNRVNRYWTAVNSGITGVTGYSAVFNYPSGEAAGNSANYRSRYTDGTNWATGSISSPSTTSSTVGSISTNSIISNGTTNQFIIGECAPATAASITITGSNPICANTNTTFKVDITGGVSPYTLVYNDGSGNVTVNNYVSGSNITVTPSAQTTYTLVSVTSALGCSASFSGSVTVNMNAPTVVSSDAAPLSQTVYISTATQNLTATGTGTGTITYQWKISSSSSSPVFVSNATGTGNATATFTPPTSGVAGTTVYYYCTITGTCGSVDTRVVSVTFTDNNIWKAGNATTNWSLGSNWLTGVAPDGTTNASIPGTNTPYPVLTATSNVKNLQIDAGATLGLNGNSLTINGTVSGTGTISGTSTSNLTMGAAASGTLYFTSGSNTIKNLTINGNTITLGNALNIAGGVSGPSQQAGVVTLASGATLVSNGNLTLKSNVYGTARIAQLPVNGSGVALATVTGNVTIERYISDNGGFRAWRLLSVPTKGAQTFKQAWQEGQAAMANGNPGYGTILTSTYGTWAANGYDAQTTAGNLLLYNNSTSAYSEVSSTNNAMQTTGGYYVYIRGDRSVSPSSSTTSATATTLRTTGTLYMGDQAAVNIGAQRYGLVGNIYPSSVDFTQLEKSVGLQNAFYIWDPKVLTGTSQTGNSLGGYNTFSATNFWEPTAPTGSYPSGQANTLIESGQAFFVYNPSTTTTNTIRFKEVAKATGNTYGVFRPANITRLKTYLYGMAKNGSTPMILDGNAVVFDNAYSGDVDANDAVKMTNAGANIGIVRSNQVLSVEGRPELNNSDTVYFDMANMKQQQYKFEFTAQNLDKPGMTAYLEDSYLNTKTPVSLNATTTATFTVDANAASAAKNRFRIVFSKTPSLPVSIASVNATQLGANVEIDWTVTRETGVRHYEVEHSANGLNFNVIGAASARNNGANSGYSMVDQNPVSGNNYYRIRSIGINGDVKFSQVVKVKFGNFTPGIVILSNPIKGNTITLQLDNMVSGAYKVNLTNANGQSVYTTVLNHAGGSAVQTLEIPMNISTGIYQVELISADKSARFVQKLVKQQD